MVDVTVETAAIPEDVTVRGDERLLRRAIANLLSNAVKFCASAGRVKLEHRRVEGVTELSVSDTGIGMRKDEIARVLKPFVQVDGSLSRRHGGIGLGLPLAKAIAELHGGTLAITSTPGSGTTVTIRLPNA